MAEWSKAAVPKTVSFVGSNPTTLTTAWCSHVGCAECVMKLLRAIKISKGTNC